MSDFGFGYSDDSFQDYSWFRNSIDNSGGSSGSGGSGGNGGAKVGCLIVAISVFIAVCLKGCSWPFGSTDDSDMIEDTSMFDDDSYDWDDCDSVVMDTIGVSENPFEKEKANVKETSAHNSYYYSSGHKYYYGDDDEYDEDGYDESGYDRQGYDRKGYDRHGYDREGYDEEGIDEDGYDEDGNYSDDW